MIKSNIIMGIMLRMKFMSLWNSINLSGLYWIKSPSIKFYRVRMKLYGKKSRFYNLLNPEMVFIIDPGRYDVKMYTVKNTHCINCKVYWIRYVFAVNIARNTIIKIIHDNEWKSSINPANTLCALVSKKSVLSMVNLANYVLLLLSF